MQKGEIELKRILMLVMMAFVLIPSTLFSTPLRSIKIDVREDMHVLETEAYHLDDANCQESLSRDRNNIDDLIEVYDQHGKTERTLDIFVHYDHHPSARSVASLQCYADVTDIYRNLDIIAAVNASIRNIENYIAKLPGVIKIEWQGSGAQCGLDISTKAVKARPSDLYSPYTAWESGFTGKEVNIAILDTGVDNEHESFTDKFVAGYNAFTSTVTDPDDDHGHGTHVAGIAMGEGGTHPEYKGVAPDAKVIDVKVLDSTGHGPSNVIIRGIDWCISNRDTYNISILSMSIYVREENSDGSDAMSQAINRAVDAGIVAVVCAGNTPGRFIGPIAAADQAITIGAIYDENTVDRSDDDIWWSSSNGPRNDDGDSDRFDELKPDLVAPGVSIMAPQSDTTSGYLSMTGTSMATPHVAGVAALMLERNPSLTPDQIKEALHITAEDKDGTYDPALDPKYDALYGWGELDAFNAISVCEVTFETDPASGGSISFEGQNYLDGDTDMFLYGTSGPVSTTPSVEWVFDHWVTSGNVEIVDDTLTITCGGTVTAVFLPVVARIFLDPSDTVGSPPDVGDTFMLTLRVDPFEDFYAWTVDLTWDPTIVEYANVAEGECLKFAGSTLFLSGTNTPGKIEGMMCTLLGDPGTYCVDVPPAPNDLANITFRVLDYTCEVGTWINITGSRLKSCAATDIPHTSDNAKLTLIPCDLVVSDVELPYQELMIYTNTTYVFRVNVTNLNRYGSSGEFNVSLELFWVPSNAIEHYEKIHILGLGPKESNVTDFSVKVIHCGEYILTVIVDCDDDVIELNEANNSMEISIEGRLPGDLDGDRDVDFDDIVTMAMAYGSKHGDPTYNELADLDCDSSVDFDDIVEAAMNYKKSCGT